MKLQASMHKWHKRQSVFAASGLLVWCFLLAIAVAQPTIVYDVPANARMTKNEVIAVQVELRRLGYLKTRLSAELDPETRIALREYQLKYGLPTTGKIDPATYRRLGLPYPAPKPGEQRVVSQAAVAKESSSTKEGTRGGLEKTWDAGGYAVSKSMDATVKGVKVAGSAAKRKADSIIRRNDEDTQPEVAEVFDSKPEWSGLVFIVKDGMVTIKLPPKSRVDIGTLVSEVRKVAGVRYVFVVVL
ncbi:MAG: peptidoglycan-binding protein [Acidobacteriota bacterium]|nr:peptidoglycan-binding protein [Acidobacteriota bacterium]